MGSAARRGAVHVCRATGLGCQGLGQQAAAAGVMPRAASGPCRLPATAARSRGCPAQLSIAGARRAALQSPPCSMAMLPRGPAALTCSRTTRCRPR